MIGDTSLSSKFAHLSDGVRIIEMRSDVPIGRRLARLRTDMGLSIEDLAAASGVDPAAIIVIEEGYFDDYIDKLWALTAALDHCPAEVLSPPDDSVRQPDLDKAVTTILAALNTEIGGLRADIDRIGRGW